MTLAGRVLIANRHPVQSAAIRESLEESGFEVVAETGDAASTVAAAVAHRPDGCLVHSVLVDGFADVVHRIRSQTPVLRLSRTAG